MNDPPRLLPERPSFLAAISGMMRKSLGFKLLLVGGILLVLQIPLAMTYGVRAARERTLWSVEREVAGKWGGEQTIGPPALTLVAEERWTETRTVQGRAEETPCRETAWQVVLPNELAAEGTVEPEVRSRGIYQVVLHRASVRMKGVFAVPPRAWRHETGEERAFVSVGVPDAKGLKRVRLVVGGEEVPVEPGTAHVWGAGFRAALDPAKFAPGASVPFELEMVVNGSGDLLFTPAGRNFSLKLDGPWPSPSFTGETLPDAREVGPEGFSAEWNVMELNRPYPQTWRCDEFRAAGAASGLSLVLPANSYQQVDRAMKYASLFVLVVLFAVLAAERLTKTAAHPVQYFVAALALVLFGMLLLSLSEHMAFAAAYAVSALVVAGMTGAYAGAVFRRRAAALALGGLALASYAVMFAVLRLESMALLLGTLVLVGILAFLMALTARMNR